MSRYTNRELCRNCKYHLFDPDEGASACVNPDSDEYMSYTPYDDVCEEWQEKIMNRI